MSYLGYLAASLVSRQGRFQGALCENQEILPAQDDEMILHITRTRRLRNSEFFKSDVRPLKHACSSKDDRRASIVLEWN